MAKPMNINCTYKTESVILTCLHNEFLEKAANYFDIDMTDKELYCVKKNTRYKISVDDLTDIMKIEIIDKNSLKLNGRKSTRTYAVAEDPSFDTFIDNLTTKLTNNNPLTGIERKKLIEMLPKLRSASKKRKLDDKEKSQEHKKTQVCMYSKKDSCTQTNFVRNPMKERQESAGTNGEQEDEDIPTKLRMLATSENSSKQEVAKLMKMSFDERRNFIFLKIPTVSRVKDKYPLLFSLEMVRKELDNIFYPGICSQFISNMKLYSSIILKTCEPNDDMCIRTMKSVERAVTDVQKSYAEVVGSVFVLNKLLDEDYPFIHLNDNAHGSSDLHPYINASFYSLKEVFFDNVIFSIMTEGLKLCEAPNFPEAILCLVASFFIFNIEYPDSCRRTLIAFEKLYLCANDTEDVDNLTDQMIKLLQIKAANQKR